VGASDRARAREREREREREKGGRERGEKKRVTMPRDSHTTHP